MVSQCRKGEGNVNSGRAEASGEVRAQVGCGEHKEEAVWHRKIEGEGRGKGGGGSKREGKMRTEHFKLTQNSIVKDKSRGKIQLKGTSPGPTTAKR